MISQSRTWILFSLVLFAASVHAQITVDFTASRQEACGSLQASFNGMASSTAGSIVSWSWDLGGVISSSQNPGRIFGTPGKYRICLKVRDSAGNSATVCKDSFIIVHALPTAAFSATPRAGCSPLESGFQDLSVPGDGVLKKWIWGLGGSVGVLIDTTGNAGIRSTYALPDAYTVSLTVIDSYGCSHTVTRNKYLEVYGHPEIRVRGVSVFSCDPPFSPLFVNDNPEPNVVYTWDMGNGQRIQGLTPVGARYLLPGAYSVTITALDTLTGCTDTLTLPNEVQVGYPVGFSFSPGQGCSPLKVQFRDTTGIQPDSVLWNFGDNNLSSELNPEHTYQFPGCYTASLTFYKDGCRTIRQSPVCIRVFDEAVVSYQADTTHSCSVPLRVRFTGQSPNAVSWNWSFGTNGVAGTSTDQNPVVDFPDYGIFPVTLTVTTAEGCTQRITTDTIRLVKLKAMMKNSTIRGCKPLTFSLEESSVSDSPIVSWEWEINGQRSSLASPEFTISDTGVFDVKLIVKNASGCTDSAVFSKVVSVGQPPIPDFFALPRISCIMDSIQFWYKGSGNADEWVWLFGDGSKSNEVNPKHHYNDIDKFDVTLIVSHYGCSSSLTLKQYIEILAPVARIEAIRTCGNPYRISFVDKSVKADSVFWDFGVKADSTDTTSQRNPVFVFPDTGKYTISLLAFNDSTKCNHSTSLDLYITDPVADFELTPQQGCVPLKVTVKDKSSFASIYIWNAPGGQISNDTLAEPAITFDKPGKYTNIGLIITDINGCKDTLVKKDTLYAGSMDARFSLSPDGGCMPLTVRLQDQSSSLFAGSWLRKWTIGGWQLGDVADTTLLFPGTGSYPVLLQATDAWGCTGEYTDTIHVTRPEAAFEADTLGCTKQTIQFKNLSVGSGLAYQWTFGDGATSTDSMPSHRYTKEGVYSVCLTVRDQFGCDSTLCRKDYITIRDPKAAMSIDTNGNCPPLLVYFQNKSVNATQFSWNFGDSSGISDLRNPPHIYTEPGRYTVTLIASSSAVCSDTLVNNDFIVLEGPVGGFRFRIDTSCIPMKVTFFGHSDDYYWYIWDFGDGRIDSSKTRRNRDSVVYFYNEIGAFVPKLILVNAYNCQRTYQSPDTIRTAFLDVDFTATDTVLCDRNATRFFNLSNSNMPITRMRWSFPGGVPGTSTASEPVVSYPNPGLFNAALLVSNAYCTDSLVKNRFIHSGSVPVARFSPNRRLSCEPATFAFSDSSRTDAGRIVSWKWELGDTTIFNARNPYRTFKSGRYPITLTVRTDLGCEASTSDTVSVRPPIRTDLWKSRDFPCLGDSVLLKASILEDTAGLSWFWSPSTGLNCSTCLSPISRPKDTIVYSFYVRNVQLGCETVKSITVTPRPYPLPNVTVSKDTAVCAGGIAQLLATGGQDLFSYAWDTTRSGLNCYQFCANPIATPRQTTTYVVRVTNKGGCTATDSVTVRVNPPVPIHAGPDRIICAGDSVQLSVDLGSNPQWQGSRLSCVYCQKPWVKPADTSTYIVKTTVQNCTSSDTVVVFVIPRSLVDAGTDREVCVGESVVLEGKGAGKITWYPPLGMNDTNNLRPVVRPLVSTTYYLTMSLGGCSLRDSVRINVVERTDVTGGPLIACIGDTVVLDFKGFADLMRWFPENGLSDPAVRNPRHVVTRPTTFTVVASLKSCQPDTAVVQIIPKSSPEVSLTPLIWFFPGQSVELKPEVKGSGPFTYAWTPAERLSCADCQFPVVTPTNNARYRLVVTDQQSGCQAEKQTLLKTASECTPDLIFVPNAFTPNGDGHNDVIRPYSGLITHIRSFSVYDRWGELIFYTEDMNEGWNGVFRGQEMDPAVFVYHLEAVCPLDGSTIVKKGDFTLIR